MTTKRLPDSLKEANEFILSNITDDTYIPLFTKSGNTEVMRKIKAQVLNNGGGSTPAAQPNRVIVIDSSLENNIEGKAYKTFAEAKTYMEANPSLKFCVELPAGDFGTTADDHITLSEQWEIHGNKTKIVAPIDSKIVETGNKQGIFNTSRSIQNCTISEGFVVDAAIGATGIKCYHVYDCVILKMSTDEGKTATTAAIICQSSTIKTHNEISHISTGWHYGIFINCDIINIEVIAGNPAIATGNFLFFDCAIGSSRTSNIQVNYVNCEILGSVSGHANFFGCHGFGIYLEGSSLSFFNSNFSNVNIDFVQDAIILENSLLNDVSVTVEKTLPMLTLEKSGFTCSSLSDHFIIATLYCDAISMIAPDANLFLPTRNANIVYSTDGGTTMSNDPTDAKHFGICKDLAKTVPDVGNYMWFPMPE